MLSIKNTLRKIEFPGLKKKGEGKKNKTKHFSACAVNAKQINHTLSPGPQQCLGEHQRPRAPVLRVAAVGERRNRMGNRPTKG